MEAVHHCVWEDPKGNLIDITPARLPFSKILFIPDDRIAYDGRVIDSIKINITIHVVDDHILLDVMRNILIAQSPEPQEGRRVMTHPLWPKYKKWGQDVMQFLVEGNTHSSPCYCNSGLPYAECHGELLRQAVQTDRPITPDLVVRLQTDQVTG